MTGLFLKDERQYLLHFYEKMSILSIKSALREQKLEGLFAELSICQPDLIDQYSTIKIDTDYLRTKVRGQHAFQIRCALKAIDIVAKQNAGSDDFYIVDVGDSAGTHIAYLKYLLPKDSRFASLKSRFLSVNMDPVAINKIRSKGMDAALCRAEDLSDCIKQKVHLLMAFQMMEHLASPIQFLDTVSKNAVSDYFVLTVPYLTRSRVGLHYIRHERCRNIYPETTHIFELSAEDWKLIFMHSGWEVIEEMVYYQYPMMSWLRLMKPLWKRYDYDGFYGVILKRNRKWTEYYKKY